MSHAATTWAFAQKIESSTKFVLVALADYAGRDNRIYPSTRVLQAKTCLDRKTILSALKRLRDLGFIQDTGNRIGKTKSIPVYQLNLEAVPKTEQVRKRSRSENGTTSSPKNGTSTEQQVIYCIEPSKEPSLVKPKINRARASSESEVIDYVTSLRLPGSDGRSLWLKWEENGWKNNGQPIKDWKMTIQRWKHDGFLPSQRSKGFQSNGDSGHSGEWLDSNKENRSYDPECYVSKEGYEEHCREKGWIPNYD